MDIVDRFIKYTQFDTESNEQSGQTPSSPGQMVLAKHIVEELKEIGLADVSVDEKGYVMATLPANCSKSIPTIGFIAHMDTSPDLTGKDVQARTVFYTGGDLVLDEEGQIIMSPSMFPELNRYKNQDLIVTNGHTLLGADDKAGVAAIVSAMDYLIKNPEIEHGTIRIGFTPDEEIGQGADHFDVKKFGADWAYTIDGGELGELEFENFNAAAAVITIKGLNVHPGSAKDKMVNASLLAMEIASWLPAGARPEQTEGYEGFYHLIDLQGSVEKAKLTYIIRDHSTKMFEKRKEMMESIVKRMNEIHPDSTTLEMHDQYYNMKDQVTDKPHIIELAKEGMKAVGVEPKIKPIRGGTDGARLSYMGLPCPNIFAGGLNFHGRYEFLPIASLRKSMQTIAAMTQILAQKY